MELAMDRCWQDSCDDFILEDDSEDDSIEDIDARIAEEHDKFLQQQAAHYEELSSWRPWSMVPLNSPAPVVQQQRHQEPKGPAQQDSGMTYAEAMRAHGCSFNSTVAARHTTTN
eukprot:jgi/Chrzof1/2498/Cz11g17230.t1